jgi:cell division protein FtsB
MESNSHLHEMKNILEEKEFLEELARSKLISYTRIHEFYFSIQWSPQHRPMFVIF